MRDAASAFGAEAARRRHRALVRWALAVEMRAEPEEGGGFVPSFGSGFSRMTL
jgi:hypothetical protein